MRIFIIFVQLVKHKMFRFKKNRRVFWLLAILLSLLLIFIIVLFSKDFSRGQSIKWGVTFSKKYATELGLNWQKTYLDILYDLKVDKIRIPIYWDEVEAQEGKYNFDDYIWMVETARYTNAKVILVLGRRQPRWPECYAPDWSNSLPNTEIEMRLLDLIKAEVAIFKSYDNVIAWQVENEPLLSIFGECPPPNRGLLIKEAQLVREADPTRPVMLTDSGELSSWFRIAGLADTLGTTMYRIVWNKHLGYTYYPLPPAYYRYKADIVKKFNPNIGRIIISELQAEPWSDQQYLRNMPLKKQLSNMSLERIQMNLRFAQATGLNEAYLWGVEWWYWLKERQNMPEFWEFGKRLWP